LIISLSHGDSFPAGVTHAIRVLGKEVSTGMAMLGITSLGQLDADACLRKLR
jgi:isopentenyl diphosphate isomerase/L-lactate dehydrogenase-like FMN-dependent dehydrogenase